MHIIVLNTREIEKKTDMSNSSGELRRQIPNT